MSTLTFENRLFIYETAVSNGYPPSYCLSLSRDIYDMTIELKSQGIFWSLPPTYQQLAEDASKYYLDNIKPIIG